MDLNKSLHTYFGFTSFRDKQHEIIQDALQNIDQFIILPTGSGKSLCYQLPALIQNGITIVISPLKSLIIDQIANLNKFNIKAFALYGDIKSSERRDIMKQMLLSNNDIKLVYTTPETIDSSSGLFENLKQLKESGRLNRFVIDEAHCISLWGNDFRNSYRNLAFLKKHFNVPIMALTATATNRVQKDTLHLLQFDKPKIYITSYLRNNLNIRIAPRQHSTISEICNIFQNKYTNQSCIVYCISRKKCEEISTVLQQHGILARPYHAGLHKSERTDVQEKWFNGNIQVIVATIAFGMGIDKKDVRAVIHYNLPFSLENYYQEIGRAGRDGKESDCILYYSYQDKIVAQQLIRNTSNSDKSAEYIKHQIQKLDDVIQFIENKLDCRHYLIGSYLGEYNISSANCIHSCDNCKRDKTTPVNVTDIAILILNAIMCIKSPTESKIRKFVTDHKASYHRKYDNIMIIYPRILTHLIVHRYIRESYIQTNTGYWREHYQLYKKSQSILEKKQNILLNI